MRLRERVVSQRNLNLMEIIGAVMLALLFIAPVVYLIFYRVVNFVVATSGVETPVSLPVAGVVFVTAVFISVWSAFRVVEWYYA